MHIKKKDKKEEGKITFYPPFYLRVGELTPNVPILADDPFELVSVCQI
jgi:hypothetical protein